MKAINSEDIAYIAGIMDGEGHMDFIRLLNRPRLRISQVDRRMLDWIKDTIGAGTIATESRATVARKEVYTYQLAGWDNCIRLSLLMWPHLLIKREQIERVLGNKLDPEYLGYLKQFRSRASEKWTAIYGN